MFRTSHLPLRLATGAFIVNSGITKLKRDNEDVRKEVHGLASEAYPQFRSMDAQTFGRLLGAGEVAVGVALLSPFVSPGLAGAGLTGFSAGLLGLYLKLPGMRQGDGIRPTQQGIPIAKDSWMLAIGLGLMLDAAASRAKKVVKAIPAAWPGGNG